MITKVILLQQRSSRRAFTLLELLVVIAVVGVLAAILVPVTFSAREKARDVKCLANLRAWSSAIQAYSLDNKHEVHWYAHDDGPGNWVSNGGPYRNYFGTNFGLAPLLITEHRSCPSDNPDNAVGYVFVLPSYDDGQGGVGSRFGLSTKLRLNSIQNPAEFLLMADGVYGSGGDLTAGGGQLGIDKVIKPVTDGTGGQWIRHGGKVHVLFADFHVSQHTYEDFERKGDTWMVLQGVKAPD